MIHKKLTDISSFLAGDHTHLKEVFHKKNGDPQLPYSVAHATIDPGKSSLPHTLQSAELYLIITGSGEANVNQQRFDIAAGSCFLVESTEEQYLSNTGNEPLQFFCIVSPPWNAAEEEIS